MASIDQLLWVRRFLTIRLPNLNPGDAFIDRDAVLDIGSSSNVRITARIWACHKAGTVNTLQIDIHEADVNEELFFERNGTGQDIVNAPCPFVRNLNVYTPKRYLRPVFHGMGTDDAEVTIGYELWATMLQS